MVMENYTDTLFKFFVNQSFIVSYVIPIILSPIIASTVFTQLSSSKRNKTVILTQKLEELYLLIEKARFQLFERVEVLKNNPEKEAKNIDVNTLHSIDSVDRLSMYTYLYFPLLAKSCDRLKKANTEVNSLILKYLKGESISDTGRDVVVNYINCINKINQEIIDNKPLLVKENILPKKYKI